MRWTLGGVVTPGNSRARNRSRSRRRRAWKAPTRLQYLVEFIDEKASDRRAVDEYFGGKETRVARYRRFGDGSL